MPEKSLPLVGDRAQTISLWLPDLSREADGSTATASRCLCHDQVAVAATARPCNL